MRSIVKGLAAVVFSLLVALPSFGKLKVLIAVDAEDPSIRLSIISALSARLNSTDRYTVVENVHGVDLLFGVLCVKARINGRVIGVTCASSVEYYPFESPLGHRLGGAGTMIFDTPENLRSMADTLVDEFINNTTESKLLEYKAAVMALIHGTCDQNPSICRNP